jgi:flavin reductase (DIM6/NTAB) family NADH-FMN oxidoreductase RutF
MNIETANLDRQTLHDLLGCSISPLPIAFISTVGQSGTYNAAPFSFVAPVCSKPPIICVSFGLRKGQKKDTVRNIEFSRDFVVNTVDESLIKQAIKASADYPPEVDEIKKVGLTALRGEKVKSPWIAESKISLECRLVQKIAMIEQFQDGQGSNAIIFGEVVFAHIKDEVLVNGKIDPMRLGLIGRVGQDLYCRTVDTFKLERPVLK